MSLTLTKTPDSVVLRSAVPGNSVTHDFGSAAKRTTGGSYVAVRDGGWPILRTYQYEVRALTLALKDALIQFLEDHNAEIIDFTDHEGITRQGVIVNDPEFITDRDNCSYETQLQIMESA